MFCLKGKVIKMLVNSLSGKSFLAQIILGIVFLVLFYFKIQSFIIDWESIAGISLFLLTIVLTFIFFRITSLVKFQGFALWFYAIWMLCFSEIAIDLRFTASLLTCSIIFWRLIEAEQTPENIRFLFDIGLLLSIAGFFYPPSFFLIGFLLFVFLYMRSVNLKGLIIFLIGFTLPLVVGIQVLYLIGQMDWLNSYHYAFCLDFWSYPLWGLIPLVILILVGWADHLSQSTAQDIHKRRKYFLSFLYFINWIVILALYGGENLNLLAFLGLPLSIFLVRFTQYQKSEKTKEILLWLYLAIVAGFYFRYEIMEIYDDLLGNVAF